MRPNKALSVVAALVATIGASGVSCGADPVPPNVCDDAVVLKPEHELPKAMRDRGFTRGVGAGDVWFVAGEHARWGDRLEPRDGGFAGKFPLWVGGSREPRVEVIGVRGTDGQGTASLSPTAEGLPGPLPVGVEIPAAGCWLITAAGQIGQAEIVVNAQLAEVSASPTP